MNQRPDVTDPLVDTPVLGGNYVITEKLGEGGMGAVYVARHTRLDEKIVIKVLLPEFNQSAEIVQRFQNEALAASRIKHRNIIHVSDVGVLEGSYYIAMEHLEGKDLEVYLQARGRLALDEALSILVQVCSGLQAAHDRDIVHRDLKPANIFINGIDRVLVGGVPHELPRVKLLDFGIAKLGDPDLAGGVKTATHRVMGTPMYMSVEQARGYAIDQRADIYSLGAIAYQLLAGQLPYTGNSLADIIGKQLGGPHPEPLPGIPDSWNRTILTSLSSDAGERPPSAHTFCRQLWQGDDDLTMLAASIDLDFANRASAHDATRKAPGQLRPATNTPRTGSTASLRETTTLRGAAGVAQSAPTMEHAQRLSALKWALPVLIVLVFVGGALIINASRGDAPPKRSSSTVVSTSRPSPDFDPTKPLVDQRPPATGKKAEHGPVGSFDPRKPSVDAKPAPTSITIRVKPARAVVSVDGVIVRKRPIVLKRGVGTRVVLNASLKGYRSATETLVVPNERTHDVIVTLHWARRRPPKIITRTKPKPPTKPKPKPIDFDPTKPEIR